ncbi:hypothetical protein D3C75_1130350 [compost metagenome]
MTLAVLAVHPLQVHFLVQGQGVQAGAGLLVDRGAGQPATAHRLGRQLRVAIEEGLARLDVAGTDARHHGLVQRRDGSERPGVPGLLGHVGRVLEDIAEYLDELRFVHRVDRGEVGGLRCGLGHGH